MGCVTLNVDEIIKSRVLPCRNISITVRDRVKSEIDNLVNAGVLTPITEPTDWVSQMAIVTKKNGDLRICIDPQPLNTALKREHYRLPVFDDIVPILNNARIFSKLDVKHAY